MPFFSVCIPAYNMGRYIGDSIASVLAQSFTDFEVIVSDNASNDDTAETVAKFSDARLRYRRNETNVGMYENLNRVCAEAHGKYIKTHCADDTMAPQALQSIFDSISRHHDSAKIWSIRHTTSQLESSKIVGPEDEIAVPAGDYRLLIKRGIAGGLPNLCVDMEYFREMGFFGTPDKDNDYSRDVITFFRLAKNAGTISIERPLVFERPHQGQSRYSLRKANQLGEYFEFRQTLLDESHNVNGSMRAWDALMDQMVANHILSAIKSAVLKRDFDYAMRIGNTLVKYRYKKIPVSNILRRARAVAGAKA